MFQYVPVILVQILIAPPLTLIGSHLDNKLYGSQISKSVHFFKKNSQVILIKYHWFNILSDKFLGQDRSPRLSQGSLNMSRESVPQKCSSQQTLLVTAFLTKAHP